MRDRIAKKKQKKHLHAHMFSHHDPCAMIFRECKMLAVLDCEEQHNYFSFHVSYFLSVTCVGCKSSILTVPPFRLHF